MRGLQHRRAWSAAGVIASSLAVGAFGLAPAAAQTGPVSPVPDTGTPALAASGTTEQVRQIVQCGPTMFAVGSFTKISQGGNTVTRNNVFSFNAVAPYTITSWDPNVNGVVNSIAFAPGSNCADAYIGGQFSTVGATAAKNIAEVNTTTGAVVRGFGHSANGAVETLLVANGHVLAGGLFTKINGSAAHPFYASLDPATGHDDGYLGLAISGHYSYPGAHANSTEIYNQQLSPDGAFVLAEGVFTKVGGKSRQQIFMMRLAATDATVTNWNSPEFSQHCAAKHPFYLKAAAWAPDGSAIYVAGSDLAPLGWDGTFPLTGLCDAVAAFPATLATGQTHSWINYTGCDALYSVAADSSAVYAGGTERWANNANGCNNPGTGALPAEGMGGFDPASGTLLTNNRGTKGLYSRARGLGADDMLLTGAGLWIASDNFAGSDKCGGISGLAGICFLPYS
jgi:hypothetical protein